MTFDWRYFTETDYKNMINGYTDFVGSICIGDICIELVIENGGIYYETDYRN